MAAPSPPNGKNPSTGTVSVGNSRAPPLTFSTALFRHISPALYLQRHLNHVPPARPSGRYPSQHRDFTLTTNSLSHAHGSAVVRTGDTAVVCGVRGEVLTLAPGDDFLAFESHHRSQTSTAYASGSRGSGGASWGELVVPNLELSTGCSKKYPLGPPGASAQTISDQIQELIQVSKLVDLKSLRIYAQAGSQGSPPATIRGYWSLYVDVLCISLDGNLLDAAWYAIVAALQSLKLPLATWSQTEERIFCDKSFEHPVSIRHDLPFVTSFVLVPISRYSGVHVRQEGSEDADCLVLNDPDALEEEEATETLTILSSTMRDRDGKDINSPHDPLATRVQIERIEKIGGCKIGGLQLRQCVLLAESKSYRFAETLLKAGLTSR